MKRVEKSGSRGVEEKTARRGRPQGHGQTASSGDACKSVARVLGTRVAGESAREHAIDPEMVEIRPEPSPSERTAILIALEQMLGAPRDEAPRPFAWAVAGRRESMPGSGAGSRIGWGRGGDRLAGW